MNHDGRMKFYYAMGTVSPELRDLSRTLSCMLTPFESYAEPIKSTSIGATIPVGDGTAIFNAMTKLDDDAKLLAESRTERVNVATNLTLEQSRTPQSWQELRRNVVDRSMLTMAQSYINVLESVI